jgi:hypothetical protein
MGHRTTPGGRDRSCCPGRAQGEGRRVRRLRRIRPLGGLYAAACIGRGAGGDRAAVIADGGSDRLIDAVIPHGTPERSPWTSTFAAAGRSLPGSVSARPAAAPAHGRVVAGAGPALAAMLAVAGALPAQNRTVNGLTLTVTCLP